MAGFLFVVLVVECVANSSVEFCHEYARGEVDHFGEVAHHVDGDGRFEAFESLPYVGVGYSHMFAQLSSADSLFGEVSVVGGGELNVVVAQWFAIGVEA